MSAVKIEESWKNALAAEWDKPYFAQLKAFLVQEKNEGQVIYPPGGLIFNAFDTTPFDQVKVVILGQDPYHGAGQAHGLCFSVQMGVAPPPSLVNIFKELHSDLGLPIPRHGNLEGWARQGVLLLNTLLTVRASQPLSHKGKGWETFTDAAIQALNRDREGIIFLLWGKPAQEKGKIIDGSKHIVLRAAHPSPLSAHNGFFGCKHFSRVNEELEKHGLAPIDWQV
ncbi:MAG: uracil-DNA glycosylase [Bacteroidetes bacterium]|nr:MAG: uracil-DNA glycosylase [Bacteroidota bacterium]